MDDTTDAASAWYWEGNVVDTIAQQLAAKGWRVVAKANTRSKERGVDLHVERDGRTLLIEAKGFPSTSYRDPRRAGEIKLTKPNQQAERWYSHALLKAMRLQAAYPNAIVALAFPDFPRYRDLFAETQDGFAKLGLAFLTVDKVGNMNAWGL